MKVRIKTSARKGYWYSDKIGEVFDVTDSSFYHVDIYVLKNIIDYRICILKDDTETEEEYRERVINNIMYEG